MRWCKPAKRNETIATASTKITSERLGAVCLTAAAFLATALVGVWAAYDRTMAWTRFWLMAAGLALSLALALAGRRKGEAVLGPAGLACGALAAGLAVYWMLTFDWQTHGVDKVAVLYQLGLWLQAHRPVVPVLEDIHSNIAGGGLALLLPPAVAGAVWTKNVQRSTFNLQPLAWLLVGVAGVGMVLTMARGAWLGLGAGVVVAVYLGWRVGPKPSFGGGPRERRRTEDRGRGVVRWGGGRHYRHRNLADILFVLAMVAVGLGIALVVTTPIMGDGSLTSRPDLWRQGLDLIADYPFTGSGLGSTKMVHASYVMMLHVGLISHMHNLFLQVAVEQGLPGLALFVGMLALAVASLVGHARRYGTSLFFLAAVASLTTLVVHGIFDAGVYASRMAPVLFVPFAFAWGLPGGRGRMTENRGRLWTVLGLVFSVFLVGFLLLSSTVAAFQENLGAVAQTRTELSRYQWPDVPIQDALRRDPAVNLDLAVAYYRAALSRNPGNAAANRRLGQIELSRGQYEAARRHLQAAYDAAPGRQAARFLLGESDAISGKIDEAVALWRTVSGRFWWDTNWVGLQAFRNRIYWYDSVGEKDKAELLQKTLNVTR